MTPTDSRIQKVLVRLQDSDLSLRRASSAAEQGDIHGSSSLMEVTSIATAEQLGELIQRQRMAKGITQGDLADLASISLGTVKHAEQGRNIGLVPLFAILRALGVSIYG